MPPIVVRSFGVAIYLLGQGYDLLGAERRPDGRAVFRFAGRPEANGLESYATDRKRLMDMAAAVGGSTGGVT